MVVTMTHSQESRVSSSQDTFRLTEESISRGMECTGIETGGYISDALEPSLGHLSRADYCAGIFALPCVWKSCKEVDSTPPPNELPFSGTEEKCVSALVNRLNSCLAVGTDVFDESSKLEKMAATSNQDEKKLEATFPWLATFWDLCQAALGSRSIKRLENLLSFYLGNVTANVKDCYMKPNRAAKLRKCMNESLAYFHLFYQDIREPMEHSSYLDKMTDLVSMYMDMEIKASRRRKESLKKIACRLSSSLYIFLDNSEDHILDAILKAKLVNKNYREVCIPLLGKILNNMRTYPLYEMLYVRYLLVFKIWKKVVADPEERKHINKIAVQKLNPPPNFMEKSKIFNNVLPRIPKSKKNITLFFMQAKFNLKNACTAFLKGCKDSQQSGFSQTLSVNMDKPNFFNERLDQVPDKENMTNTGGSNLIEDIWSSLSNPESGLTENSQLQELSRNKSKPDQLTGKRKKEKCKKKQKKKDKAGKKDKLLDKGKKKKKKILSENGDTASVLSDTTFGITSLLKKSGKGEKAKKKKKKKSADVNLEPSLLAPCDAGAEESVCMLESNAVADSASPAISEAIPQPTSQDLIQASSQVLVQAVGNAVVEESVPQKSLIPSEIVPDGTSEVKAEVGVELRMEVCVDTEAEAQTRNSSSISIGQSQVMVNQVNSAGESLVDSVVKEVYSEEGEKYAEKDKFIDPESLNQVNQVNSAGCLDESHEQIRVTVIATGGRDPVVPSSSCNISEELASSQKSALVSQENEAIASEVCKKSDEMSVDAVLPRTVRDPILVPSQTSCDPEAVSYACDSSIKNEIPISEEGAPVGRDNFNSVPMEIDSDVEILAELRPQVTVKCGGVAEEEIVLSDDGEIMRQESQLDNIFATENEDLVIEMLGGVLPGGLQVPSIELNSSTHSEEGGEPESPEIETFDVYETLSLNDMMNNFLRSKGDFSQYGGERRDCLYRDSMLHPATQSNYDRLAALQGSVSAHQFMEDDECEEATTDDELESCYELSHSHSNYAHNKRPCIKGGKVGFNGAVSSNGYASVSVNEKEVSGGSPSSCVENDNTLDSTVPSKNSFISSRNNLFNSASDSIAAVSGRDTPSHPHVGLETTALSPARSPTSSTPKRLSDVNTMRYYTSTLDQPVQSERVENRTENTSLDASLNKRPSTPKKTPSSTNTVQHTQSVLPRVVDSSFMNRRVSVQLTQLSPDSASGGFPDVVLDAHKVSGQREKETMKSPSRGRGRGRGRPATRRTSMNTRVTRHGGSVSKKKTSPEPVSVRETRTPVVNKEKSRKGTHEQGFHDTLCGAQTLCENSCSAESFRLCESVPQNELDDMESCSLQCSECITNVCHKTTSCSAEKRNRESRCFFCEWASFRLKVLCSMAGINFNSPTAKPAKEKCSSAKSGTTLMKKSHKNMCIYSALMENCETEDFCSRENISNQDIPGTKGKVTSTISKYTLECPNDGERELSSQDMVYHQELHCLPLTTNFEIVEFQNFNGGNTDEISQSIFKECAEDINSKIASQKKETEIQMNIKNMHLNSFINASQALSHGINSNNSSASELKKAFVSLTVSKSRSYKTNTRTLKNSVKSKFTRSVFNPHCRMEQQKSSSKNIKATDPRWLVTNNERKCTSSQPNSELVHGITSCEASSWNVSEHRAETEKETVPPLLPVSSPLDIPLAIDDLQNIIEKVESWRRYGTPWLTLLHTSSSGDAEAISVSFFSESSNAPSNISAIPGNQDEFKQKFSSSKQL